MAECPWLSDSHQRVFASVMSPDADHREARKVTADYAAKVGRDMWLAGIQECLRLAKIYVKSEQDRVFDETAQPYDEIDWAKFEKQLERL